jgi:peptidoglycan hydrolase-like protein with peptidoglycan-binding domain
MIADLPALQQGDSDKAGQVFYVHRMQALTACYGRINNIASAACILENGTFDAATKTAVQAVQAHKKVATDGICGPITWSILIAGKAA